jgi:uncharacterized damage-inducible protein DinB
MFMVSGFTITIAVMSVAPWFERKFDFHFPVEQFPNVLIRLRGTPARIEEILRRSQREVLIRKPPQKWSAQEHAGHLLDMEPLWRARVDDFLLGAGTLTVADLTNRRTDEANHNAQNLSELLSAFRQARSELLAKVDHLEPHLFERSLVHPRLQQPMRLVDHLFFVAEHDDHHLAAIWELIAQ